MCIKMNYLWLKCNGNGYTYTTVIIKVIDRNKTFYTAHLGRCNTAVLAMLYAAQKVPVILGNNDSHVIQLCQTSDRRMCACVLASYMTWVDRRFPSQEADNAGLGLNPACLTGFGAGTTFWGEDCTSLRCSALIFSSSPGVDLGAFLPCRGLL